MKDIRKTIRTWALKVGQQEAVGRLVKQGVSPRAAEQLCAGTYASQPKSLREKLIRQLVADGFLPQREELAS